MGITLGGLNLLTNGVISGLSTRILQISVDRPLIAGEMLSDVKDASERVWLLGGMFEETSGGVADWKELRSMVAEHQVVRFTCTTVNGTLPIYAIVIPRGKDSDFAAGEVRLNYNLELVEIPAWGRTMINTATAGYVLDLNYRKTLDDLYSSLWYKTNFTLSESPKYYEYEFYVRNDHTSDEAIVLEFMTPDNLTRFILSGWKTAAWNEIGDWGSGGSDSWGELNAWTDNDTISHDVTVNKTTRGGTVSGMTSLMKMGCNQRVLVTISNMKLNDTGGADSSSKVASDQLLLKARAYFSDEVTTWIA